MGVSVGMPGNQMYIPFHYKGENLIQNCPSVPLAEGIFHFNSTSEPGYLKQELLKPQKCFFVDVIVVLVFECKNSHRTEAHTPGAIARKS